MRLVFIKNMKLMRFEHKSQEVASLPIFLFRLAKFVGIALVLISFSLLVGTMGYHYLGELPWLMSFYMASMILAGMGPVAELTTTNAIVFSSIYALYSGLAFITVTAIFITPVIHRVLHLVHVEKD